VYFRPISAACGLAGPLMTPSNPVHEILSRPERPRPANCMFLRTSGIYPGNHLLPNAFRALD